MKQIMLTLALALGTLAMQAQNSLTITNDHTSDISVRVTMVDANCNVIGPAGPTIITAGTFAVIPPITTGPGITWWGVRAMEVPTGLGPVPPNGTAYNKCNFDCADNDVNNGLTIIFDTSANCERVRVN